MKIEHYFQDLDILHVNTEDDRAYSVPFPEHSEILQERREESNRFQLLNGQWRFRLYENVESVPQNFPLGETFEEDCPTLPVPSAWQMHGYGRNQYTNMRYPFPFNPPFVPAQNPCGAYVTDFEIPQDRAPFRKYLNFEGVDSCCYVWVNGRFVGYHQVSHCTGEYDITDYVVRGRNRLAVLVVKWCDGSYFEDQDKFRMSGIFRDVYLLYRPENFIRDYFIHTKTEDFSENGSTARASVEVSVQFRKATEPVVYRLFAPDGALAAHGESENGNFSVQLENPQCWNAEQPLLYTLLLTVCGETLQEKVGIRAVRVENGVLQVNGRPIKIKGVNRHDSSPFRGCAVTEEDIRTDLALMKRHNINAIRTSHYPNSPILPRLCDEYGFYLIAEADLEAHGQEMIYHPTEEDLCFFANDPTYRESILDRVKKLVQRDKNRPCILFWSLGNESGYGPNFEAAARWVRDFDTSRLIHYEHIAHVMPGSDPDFSLLDVASRMYPPTEFIREYFQDAQESAPKPLLLCEYCHSMGNGPGDLEDYFSLVYRYDGFAGGLIWEWCDHAVYDGKAENGKDRYLYGGDFQDVPNDGNFCLDGLVTPDRKLSTGLLEYKNVIRPIRAAESAKVWEFRLTNCLDFADAGDAVRIQYEITCDGAVVEQAELPGLRIPPHSSRTVQIEPKKQYEGVVLLRFFYLQKDGTALVPDGEELGFDQFRISDPKVLYRPHSGISSAVLQTVDFTETESEITVHGPDFSYVFDKRTGLFRRLTVGKTELLLRPMEYNLWRAPTDNDQFIRPEWEQAGYDCAQPFVYETGVEKEADCVRIQAQTGLIPVYRQRILKIFSEFRIFPDGRVTVSMKAEKNPIFPFLPRFGVRLFLPKSFENLSYFGYGPYESYIDKHHASYLGLFRGTADEAFEDYLKPQESGSHYGCEYLKISSAQGTSLTVQNEERFCFNLSHYTQEELTRKRHSFELEESDASVLCLDYRQSGIGSNSCGPELLKQYQLCEDRLVFDFELFFSASH